MPYHRIAPDIKEQILNRIRADGIPASQAAREHGISPKTVYGWLNDRATVPSNILQINKLRRENDDLKRLLADALLMQERSKKNHARHAF
jgi:transposase-like protein